MARNAREDSMSFSSVRFEERHGKGGLGGNVRASNVCARAKRDVRVQRTSKLAISACRNLFSFVLSLFSDKERTSNTAQRGAELYARPATKLFEL